MPTTTQNNRFWSSITSSQSSRVEWGEGGEGSLMASKLWRKSSFDRGKSVDGGSKSSDKNNSNAKAGPFSSIRSSVGDISLDASLCSVKSYNNKNEESGDGENPPPSKKDPTKTTNRVVDRYAPSRHKPKNTNRIIDINNLVAYRIEDSDSCNSHSVDDEVEVNKCSDKTPPQIESPPKKEQLFHRRAQQFHRQALVIMASVGIIIGASACIGALVMIGQPTDQNYSQSMSQEVEQERLEIAQRIVLACSEQGLSEDMSACQKLCHSKLCCFENDEYSCKDDESKECAVYAGCDALVDGIPLGAAEEDEQ